MKGDALDPKALIREAYAIGGIGPAECRTIFVDWALSVADPEAALPQLLDRYAASAPDHPMTAILREGLGGSSRTGRRGGWRARRSGPES